MVSSNRMAAEDAVAVEGGAGDDPGRISWIRSIISASLL
jgi:hypothetical protein